MLWVWATSEAGKPSAAGSYPKEKLSIANSCRFQLTRAVEMKVGERSEVKLKANEWLMRQCVYELEA